MSKIPLPLHVADISAFARTLRVRLSEMETVPSHVEMLNLLSKAGGYRNFQHLKATLTPADKSETQPQSITPNDHKRINKLMRHFDSQQRLIRWPGKFTLRMLCLWVMWSHIPPRASQTELEINELLTRWHLFEDHALLRRELVDRGFIKRTPDGRQYTRIERQPPMDAMELFSRFRQTR